MSKWDTSVWGIRVKATQEAVDAGVLKEGDTGILLGAQGLSWKVIKKDTTTSARYHKSFWGIAVLSKK